MHVLRSFLAVLFFAPTLYAEQSEPRVFCDQILLVHRSIARFSGDRKRQLYNSSALSSNHIDDPGLQTQLDSQQYKDAVQRMAHSGFIRVLLGRDLKLFTVDGNIVTFAKGLQIDTVGGLVLRSTDTKGNITNHYSSRERVRELRKD